MRSKEKNMDLTSTENEAAKKAKKADKWADKPAMEVRDLHFSYGKNKVLKGVSLKIEEGKITTIAQDFHLIPYYPRSHSCSLGALKNSVTCKYNKVKK